jgi:hypothetical protein
LLFEPSASFNDLDQGSEMIIFEWILTTFEASSIFEAAGVLMKIGLNLKLNHQIQLAQIGETHCSQFLARSQLST